MRIEPKHVADFTDGGDLFIARNSSNAELVDSSVRSEPLKREQPMPCTITVRVPTTVEGARDAVTTIRGFLDQLALPKLEATRLELALAESVDNVVEHAGCGQSGSMDISLTADEVTLQFVVRDEGKSFDTDGLNNFMWRPEEPSELAEGDRGILLIRRIMDQVIYSREENRNVLTMTALVGATRLSGAISQSETLENRVAASATS